MSMTMNERVEKFVEGAQTMINAHFDKNYPNLTPETLYIQTGPVYAKIISRRQPNDKHGSVWAFIRLEDGSILKPAGAKGPAKHSRGSIMTETFGVEFVGPYGPAYLRG